MVSDQLQQLFNQVQLYQQQMQAVLTQKESLVMQSNEIKKALEELEKSKAKDAFKISGPILIKSTTTDVKKDLKEKQESISLRVKSLEKTEKMVGDKIDDLKVKLEKSQKSENVGG
jgi:prefoldin beta subunit